jgi:hypothetical protein
MNSPDPQACNKSLIAVSLFYGFPLNTYRECVAALIDICNELGIGVKVRVYPLAPQKLPLFLCFAKKLKGLSKGKIRSLNVNRFLVFKSSKIPRVGEPEVRGDDNKPLYLSNVHHGFMFSFDIGWYEHCIWSCRFWEIARIEGKPDSLDTLFVRQPVLLARVYQEMSKQLFAPPRSLAAKVAEELASN